MPDRQRKIRPKLGDIIAIRLPDARYAYSRVYEDFMLGVFSFISDDLRPADALERCPFCFFQSCTDEAISDGRWPIVGRHQFGEDEDPWGPPQATWYDRDTNAWTTGVPRVTDRGDSREATQEEVRGLDISLFCQSPELFIDIIIDRLIHGNHAKYKVRDE